MIAEITGFFLTSATVTLCAMATAIQPKQSQVFYDPRHYIDYHRAKTTKNRCTVAAWLLFAASIGWAWWYCGKI